MQEGVVRSAMQRTRRVCGVETHGTGTALGDPIEVGALQRVLASSAAKAEPVALGAFKSQIAHAEGAAAIAGLVKVVRVLKHRHVPANLHLRETNPKLELGGFALMVPSHGMKLGVLSGVARMGVSAFGYSGTNSHAVLGIDAAADPASSQARRAGG